jgi:salicylate hydroxylase
VVGRGFLDIAIIGCGPSGMAAALFLSRAGHRVRIFERFDAPRPIGSGRLLQPTGLAVLRRLDLIEKVARAGARIDRLAGTALPSGRPILSVAYADLGEGLHGIGIHRASLFNILHDAVLAAGIEIMPSLPPRSLAMPTRPQP